MQQKSERKVTIGQVFTTIIWPRRKHLFLGLFLIIISRLSGLVLPGASKYLVDNVIPSNDLNLLKWLIIAVVVAIVIQSLTSYALTQILSVEAQNLIAKLRSKVQSHIIKLPIRFFDNAKTGELVSRIMSDVEGVRNLVGTGFAQMIGGVITSVISLVLLISISPLMTLYVLVPVAIFGLVSLKAFGRIRPIFRERGKINAQVTGRLTETLGGIRVIKGFNAEAQEIKTFQQGVDELFQNVKASLTATSFVTSAGTLLLGLASAGIMGIGGWMIMEGDITFGDFLAFTLYLGFMIAPIVQMSNIGSQLTEAFAGLDRTEEIMNTPLESDDKERTIELESIQGDIRFEDVSFAYESGKDVIKNINFHAPAGTVTALVGSSGSGKTTIAGLAATFLNPDSGNIYLDNQDLQKVSLESFRSKLGVVLQDDFLFEGTIRENILFPRPDATEEQLQQAVHAAYVQEFSDRFEDGLDTLIGERGVKLSGGQRQRIAIARAILADPKILILDEATSNLDTESETLIQASLKELMKGRTTFVIAHRLSTIRQADQILVIEHGEIAERGKHEDLISKEGRYYQLYTYQARI
ncbi:MULTISPECIES: ABC transporter ATP-binding protein [unclassified Algoriphagus]|jgi:subfamily B ATP-binding cassette protein MsbA|uniref:ABC transporter ATP-binding protein n=2 Tax=Algoriphagus TaxID=246875 RepID=UPI000C47DAC8|nr:MULTISPECIES: ABC transporter ATP-binding protein [unclassified Algoriphagus]MAL12846.1 ABC transporter permease [Algoriphagus sp.]MAN85724.1 ABC transporter permease [Algoriphagus sp.]HAH37277.1 ABC transporter permease [Algoriphagus sp.]HAS59824.1 ABC transporter permease [Algoriphagus sp.]HCB46390.1 ABC transporter permease [Algoriphagus sp.]